MSVLIRPVTEADAASIVELLNPIIRAGGYTVMQHPFTPEDQVAFIRALPHRGVYLAAAEDAGRVLGIQDVQPITDSGTAAPAHVGEVSTFVALDARRRGMGRALMERTLAVAAAAGYRKLVASIRADNPTAVAFYRNCGFERVGVARRHALIRGRYVDQVMMETWIGPPPPA